MLDLLQISFDPLCVSFLVVVSLMVAKRFGKFPQFIRPKHQKGTETFKKTRLDL